MALRRPLEAPFKHFWCLLPKWLSESLWRLIWRISGPCWLNSSPNIFGSLFEQFWAQIALRKPLEAPISKRLKLLASTVHPALFWCAGSWNLTRAQESRLRGVQLRMLRKMLGPRRQAGENLEEFTRRRNSQIKNLKSRHGVKDWGRQYFP